jgi:hypothetical protein
LILSEAKNYWLNLSLNQAKISAKRPDQSSQKDLLLVRMPSYMETTSHESHIFVYAVPRYWNYHSYTYTFTYTHTRRIQACDFILQCPRSCHLNLKVTAISVVRHLGARHNLLWPWPWLWPWTNTQWPWPCVTVWQWDVFSLLWSMMLQKPTSLSVTVFKCFNKTEESQQRRQIIECVLHTCPPQTFLVAKLEWWYLMTLIDCICHEIQDSEFGMVLLLLPTKPSDHSNLC